MDRNRTTKRRLRGRESTRRRLLAVGPAGVEIYMVVPTFFQYRHQDVTDMDEQSCNPAPSVPFSALHPEIMRLQRRFGTARWRKLKGIALVRLRHGRICRAEVHWYEAHGKGRKKMKIKKILG